MTESKSGALPLGYSPSIRLLQFYYGKKKLFYSQIRQKVLPNDKGNALAKSNYNPEQLKKVVHN
jgi:hypothetical protein